MRHKHAATAAGAEVPAPAPPSEQSRRRSDPDDGDGRFYKIVARPGSWPERRQDARGQFELLQRCRSVAGVPQPLELIEDARPQIL